MAVTVQSIGAQNVQSYGSTGGQTYAVGKPSGVAVGDLLIIQLVITDSGAITALPSGFTLIRATDKSRLYQKVADSGDVSASSYDFTLNIASTPTRVMSRCIRIDGQRSSGAIDDNNGQTNGSSTTVTSPGFTPTYPNGLVMFFSLADALRTTSGYAIATNNPGAWTESYDDQNAGFGDNITMAMAYAQRPEVSATGNGTATLSSATTNAGQMLQIGIFENASVSATVLTATFNIQAPTITGTANVTPTVVTATFSIQTPTVTTEVPKWNNTDKNDSNWVNLDKS